MNFPVVLLYLSAFQHMPNVSCLMYNITYLFNSNYQAAIVQ